MKIAHFSKLIISLYFLCIVSIGIPISVSAENEQTKTLELTLEEAIVMALENNSAFKIERLKPSTRESREIQEKALFDLGVSKSISTSRSKSDTGSSNRTNINVELTKNLLSGGDLSLEFGSGKVSDEYTSSVGISLTHPFMQGAGSDVTLANLRKAELNTLSSRYELQGYAESLVSQVIKAYWDYTLAERQLQIYEESLRLSEQQLEETKTMIEVGKVAEIERVASEAEVSLRKEALINAKSNLEKTRLNFLRLVNPSNDNFWQYSMKTEDPLNIPEIQIESLDSYIQKAMNDRPDLNQANFLLEQNKLDLLVTKNGLLPVMDFFITYGMSGYSDSFGESIKDISGNNSDFQIGIRYNQYLGNRNDRERYKQSDITYRQNQEAMNNLRQLAIQDVGIAWLEINRAKEQITATESSRKLQEEKARAETEKYRVGKSTSLLVAQAQRDLTASRINEIQSVVNYNKAIIDLLREDGALLGFFGISFIDN